MSRLRKRISQYDLIYNSPARGWLDGLAIGNGSMCALNYDSENGIPEWLVNHHSLWDERTSVFKRHPMEHVRRVAAGEFPFFSEMVKENPVGARVVPVPVYGAQLRLESGYPATMAPVHKVSRQLHLFDGILETKLSRHLSHPVMKSFMVPGEDLMVIQVRNVSCLTAFAQRIKLFRAAQPEYDAPEFYTESDAAAFHLRIGTMEYSAAVLVVSRPDCPIAYTDEFPKYIKSVSVGTSSVTGVSLEADSAVISAMGNYDVFLSISVEDSPAALITRLRASAAEGSDSLQEKNCQYWNRFWERNEVSLGNPGLEQLWYLSNYHMGISEGYAPAWGLCGPWFGRTGDAVQRLPWFGYFTNNYNAQAPVMPLPLINRPELAEGTFRMIRDQLKAARENAEYFGLPGAYYPLSCGPSGKECSHGAYRFCMMSGPYWSCMIYRHYLYTKDLEFLRKYGYDVIREVCRFFAGYLDWDGQEGSYHLNCSQNSELFYLDHSDPIDTLCFIKGAYRAGLACAGLLGGEKTELEKWQHILDHFPEYPVTSKGFSPLKGLPENHINHSRTLGPVFPAGELDPEFPGKDLESAEKELFNPTWMGFMYSCSCNDGFVEGWTGKVFHRGLAACRLGEKKTAWKSLCDLITGCVKPNGLIAHNMALLVDPELSEKNIEQIPDFEVCRDDGAGPIPVSEIACGRTDEEATEDPECKEKMYPVLEGPAIYLLLIGEMLLQGYHGLVRLFPALPDEMDASFRDLRTEGPLLVSAERKNRIVQFVRIQALEKQTFRLLNPWPAGTGVYLNGAPVTLEHHHAFTLEKGMSLILSVAPEIEPEKEIAPEPAEARLISFDGCPGAFVGKPSPAEYYTGLEKIRTSRDLKK